MLSSRQAGVFRTDLPGGGIFCHRESTALGVRYYYTDFIKAERLDLCVTGKGTNRTDKMKEQI